ncbi:helix-turn-helix domain-containing protein [Paenibacillus sp. MCAF9]|uniref:AlbA family DNA-binding domain-containing protein n=1 Tax=Paenibacillus sp. MCAF9 TaxID=3233046 RepID=UPI003F98AABF
MNRIVELIQHGFESEYLDFKEKQYSKEKHIDLIADIMAMANSRHVGDKYIIIGVKDRPEGREIKGIKPEEFVDSSNYTQVVLNNVEPDIQFDYFKYEYEGSLLGIFKIYSNDSKPYMLKRKYERLNEGLCLIRKGSLNAIAKRGDYDYMYRNQGRIEVRILESTLHAVHDYEGCASIEVLLSNSTDYQVTLVGGVLTILDNNNGEELTSHRVYGIDKYVGADFQIGLVPRREVVGRLLVGFSSSQPLQLGIDEYGIGEQDYKFELVFWDARGEEYSVYLPDGRVFVNGDFLWKVKQEKGIKHRFRTHN